MKFCLKDEYRYWWPVSVVLPHPTRPGVTETSSFEVEFRAISEDEVGEYRVKLEKMQPNEREKEGHGLREWDDKVGEPINPFSSALQELS